MERRKFVVLSPIKLQVSEEARQITDLIYTSKNIVILCAEKAFLDGVSAGLAIHHLLESMGKTTTIFYSGNLPNNINDLPGLHRIKKFTDPRDLIMSIDYEHNDIEKVKYSLDKGKLNLVFHPVPKDFNPDNVKCSLSSPGYDLVFSFGASSLNSLGKLYDEMKRDIDGITTINIDNSHDNTNFGAINVVDPNADTLSELLFLKLSSWRFSPTREVARCLLFGLSVGSDERKSSLPLENLGSAT